jgi:hypothetical protein
MTSSQHHYEVRPRKDHRGVDLISDALPFGRLWYGEPSAPDFMIKKVTAPHTDGMKGGCSPQNNAY